MHQVTQGDALGYALVAPSGRAYELIHNQIEPAKVESVEFKFRKLK